MATEFDPINNAQVTLTGNLYNYFILMLLVVTDMHHYILRAFVDAFTVIPVNGQVFDWEHLMRSMTTYMGDMFVIAFRIILPVFACIMILNCILGIMAKVSPQMNMFAVGMQICCTFSDRIIAAKCGKFHFYGNEKIDGTFYRRNVLTWNSRNSYI